MAPEGAAGVEDSQLGGREGVGDAPGGGDGMRRIAFLGDDEDGDLDGLEPGQGRLAGSRGREGDGGRQREEAAGVRRLGGG